LGEEPNRLLYKSQSVERDYVPALPGLGNKKVRVVSSSIRQHITLNPYINSNGANKMKCPKCQFENPDDAKFCIECASPIEFHCPNCGAVTPATGKFCKECAHELRKPAEASHVDYSKPKSYTPKFLTDKILTTRSSIEGERKLVTVLFADVANFTALSEKLDPEEVHQIMDGCFKILMDEIHRYEGTINQFTGDGVMALFGAPLSHEDHAQRACYAALSIQRVIADYGEKIKKDCGVEFAMRIGLNSGHVIVGSIGDDLRMDYTAVGDTTNLASRMESMAKPGTVLISKSTHRIVRDYFEYNPIGKIQVKGKEKPQDAYELIKTTKIETRIHAAAAKGLTKFVGRKNSMAALQECLDKMLSGSGQVVGVVGEAGVGKSRLILEMRNRLRKKKYTWLEGRCIHYGSSMAYLPILDILKSYFEIIEGDREFIIKKKINDKIVDLDKKLSTVIPPFQDLLSLEVDDETFTRLEPKKKRERTFESLRDLFIRQSQNAPLILVMDDLQWIDKTTEEFLNYLIYWLGNTCIMLILLYRPEYTHQWGNKSYYTKIGLDQLGTASSAELVQAILEGGEVVPELRELILSRTTGNPLFMEELTHTLIENGTIQKKNNTYVLSRKTADIQVPDTIQGIIAARMDRLEDNLKQTMQVASVIGRDFAFRILQTITGMREELKTYLLNLQGLEFIYEKSLFPELEYIFKHALTKDVAYNSLLHARRKEIHEKIGNAIEDIYASRLEEFYEMLAYHYSKSDNHQKAFQYLKLSGEKASGNYANWEAFGFYKEAINALKCLPETEENKKAQIEVYNLIYEPMILLGNPENSLEMFQDGERLSKELGDERSLARFYSNINLIYATRGEPLRGRKYAENGFIKAKNIQDIELMAPLANDCSWSYSTSGEYFKIPDIAPDTIAMIEKNRRESECFGRPYNIYSSLCSVCGLSMAMLGLFEEAKIYLEKAFKSATKINDLIVLSMNNWQHGVLYSLKGNGQHAIKHFQDSIKHCEEVNWPMLAGLSWCWSGYGHYLLGDLLTAIKYVEKGLSIHRNTHAMLFLSMHHVFLSLIHHDSGKLNEAQTNAEKALELAQKNNGIDMEGWSRICLGKVKSKRAPSQLETAEESILKGIKIVKELKLRPHLAFGYFCLGELYADAGRREDALKNLKKAESMYQEMGIGLWPARVQEVLDRV